MSVVRQVVDRAAVCSVRDDVTSEALGLRGSAPCPSLLAAWRPLHPGRGLLHVVNHSTVGAEEYEAMRSAGQAFARRTGRVYRETSNRITHHGSEPHLAALLSLYTGSDFVLSSALHGCLLAIAMGRSVLAVSGDWKIESAMAAAGLADHVLAQEAVGDVEQRLVQLDRLPPRHTEAFLDHARAANQAVAAQVRRVAVGERGPKHIFQA